MKYDKSLKTEGDKELWKFLQGGVFSDSRDECIELRKQGCTKKEIVDKFRPIYEKCKADVDTVLSQQEVEVKI